MTVSPDADVRVEFRFKNARLYHAIQEASYKDKDYRKSFDRGRVLAFCRFYGVQYDSVSQLLNLQLSPILKKPRNTYRPICVTLSDILDIDCATLFPQALYAQSWPKNFSTNIPLATFVGLGAAKHLTLPPSSFEAVANRELRELMTAAVATLTPRETRVITRRFGLDGEGERTFEEVAQEYAVCRERIRQIEAKAMRKLRHPSRSRRLRPFVSVVRDDAPEPDDPF